MPEGEEVERRVKAFVKPQAQGKGPNKQICFRCALAGAQFLV